MRQALPVVFEALAFLALITAVSFQLDVHYTVMAAVGGLAYLLIRLTIMIGTGSIARLRRKPGVLWKVGGGWGEYR